VLERVDAQAIAIGQRDPILIDENQSPERVPATHGEVAQRFEVRALVLRVRVANVARAEAPRSRARVVLDELEILWPHVVVVAEGLLRVRDRAAEAVLREQAVVLAGRVLRLERVARLGRVVEPVRARVIEDDVEHDAHADRVRGAHELDEIRPRAEARVDVQEVLHAVAVEIVALDALPEYRRYPERGHAKVGEIRKLALDARERAALKPSLAGSPPQVPAPRRKTVRLRIRRAIRRDLRAVEQRPRGLLAVREAVGQQEVKHLVPPIGR
jgi:hypothetical protein